MNMMMPIEAEGARLERAALREQIRELRLAKVRSDGSAKRLLWAVEGLCNRLEKTGADVSYWRDLANDMRGVVS